MVFEPFRRLTPNAIEKFIQFVYDGINEQEDKSSSAQILLGLGGFIKEMRSRVGHTESDPGLRGQRQPRRTHSPAEIVDKVAKAFSACIEVLT